ncbi:MAG: DoxX family protein [Bacteroidota bacterium]
METLQIQHIEKTTTGKTVWTGRIISGISIAFLLMDAIMKIMRHPVHVEGSTQLGLSVNAVQPIGITLLICTLLYIIPRTSIFGAILLTGYLGGAVAIMVLAGQAFYFPVVFGVLVWGGLFLRNDGVRTLLLKGK